MYVSFYTPQRPSSFHLEEVAVLHSRLMQRSFFELSDASNVQYKTDDVFPVAYGWLESANSKPFVLFLMAAKRAVSVRFHDESRSKRISLRSEEFSSGKFGCA
jgi:hypothetical protein